MSLSTRFLNLSIKEQICLTLIFLTLFCLLVILLIGCTLIYEILKKDSETKTIYFYKKYKQYLESSFYFQSFHSMQYEEILLRIQKQIWKIQQSLQIYWDIEPLQNYGEYIIFMDKRKEINFDELDKKDSKENPYF